MGVMEGPLFRTRRRPTRPRRPPLWPQGKRYWQGKPGFGAFVRPDKVTVGDYPPADDFSDLESGDEI